MTKEDFKRQLDDLIAPDVVSPEPFETYYMKDCRLILFESFLYIVSNSLSISRSYKAVRSMYKIDDAIVISFDSRSIVGTDFLSVRIR